MRQKKQAFYRYRAFDTITLHSLCDDKLHFSPPGKFNDPLDCSPTVECDSDLVKLRELLEKLIRRRISGEMITSLEGAKLRGERATAHAKKWALSEAQRELAPDN